MMGWWRRGGPWHADVHQWSTLTLGESIWRNCRRRNDLPEKDLPPKIYFCHQKDSTNNMIWLPFTSSQRFTRKWNPCAVHSIDSLSNAFNCVIHVGIFNFGETTWRFELKKSAKDVNPFYGDAKQAMEYSSCRRELTRLLIECQKGLLEEFFFTVIEKFDKPVGNGTLTQSATDFI